MSLHDEQMSIQDLNTTSNKVIYYSCLIIINVGFVANILNISICLRKRIKSEMMGYYNILISFFNILSLICAYMLFFPASAGFKDLLLISNVNCVLIGYTTRVFVQMSSWLHVIVSLDRTICISFPNRFAFMTNKTKISCFVLVFFIAILGLNSPLLDYHLGGQSTFIYNVTSNRTICGSTDNIILAKYATVVVMRIVVPIMLAFGCNSILIYKLFKSRSNLKLAKSMKKDYQFTFTIVMLNVAFLLTESPFIYGNINMYLSHIEELAGLVSMREIATAKLYFVATFMFSTYMFVSIFFVNVFFNSIFKREIYVIFFGARATGSVDFSTHNTPRGSI